MRKPATRKKIMQSAGALERVKRGERVLIRRGRKPIAALVPIADFQLLERLLEEEEDRLDLEAAREAMAETKKAGTIPWEKVKAELGL